MEGHYNKATYIVFEYAVMSGFCRPKSMYILGIHIGTKYWKFGVIIVFYSPLRLFYYIDTVNSWMVDESIVPVENPQLLASGLQFNFSAKRGE